MALLIAVTALVALELSSILPDVSKINTTSSGAFTSCDLVEWIVMVPPAFGLL